MRIITILIGIVFVLCLGVLFVYVGLLYVQSRIPTTAALTPTETVTPSSPAVTMLVRGSQLRKDVPIKEAGWINVKTKIGTPSEWSIPFDAAGHLKTTPQPGQAGNAVFSGHHNLVGPNRFGVGTFAYFWNLREGDRIYFIDQLGNAYEYAVSESYSLLEEGQPLSVREQNSAKVMASSSEPIVTLVTCWAGPQDPFASNTYRWIIVGKLVGKLDPSSIPPVN